MEMKPIVCCMAEGRIVCCAEIDQYIDGGAEVDAA